MIPIKVKMIKGLFTFSEAIKITLKNIKTENVNKINVLGV